MSRNSTIELLNSTDALDYRMRWQLFVQENEQAVYGDYTGWQPGQPIHPHPRDLAFLTPHYLERLELEDHAPRDGEWGSYVRPMIEDIAEGVFHVGKDGVRIPYGKPWCHDCRVGWNGEFGLPCWSCNRVAEGPFIHSNQRVELRTAFRAKRQAALQADAKKMLNVEYAQNYDHDVEPGAFGYGAALYAAHYLNLGPVQHFSVQTDDDLRPDDTAYFTWEETGDTLRNEQTLAFDVETFGPIWHRMFERRRRTPPNIPPEEYYVTHMLGGHSLGHIVLDEWTHNPNEYTVDDVTIVWPEGVRIGLPFQTLVSTRNVVEDIARRHRQEHPNYYINRQEELR